MNPVVLLTALPAAAAPPAASSTWARLPDGVAPLAEESIARAHGAP